MINFLKKLLPKRLKIFLGHIQSKFTEIVKTSKVYMFLSSLSKRNAIEVPEGKKVILVNTPIHPNLGDQAIALAEIKFIKENFVDYNFLELDDSIFFNTIRRLKRFVSKEDIIMCHGGGNMGVDYFWCEKVRRTVIKMFPDNKIVVFPQTIYYENDKKSQRSLKKSQTIYNVHKQILICAREPKSYEILKTSFTNCKIELVPDIALNLGISSFDSDRQDALCCFRDDREKNTTQEELSQITNTIMQDNQKLHFTDTVLRGNIKKDQRESLFVEKLKEIASAKILITDRLHGMIFAYLTNTPAVETSFAIYVSSVYYS